ILAGLPKVGMMFVDYKFFQANCRFFNLPLANRLGLPKVGKW
ncbi:MAG: hypothetical protein RI903_365, partial [Bacteroidota bacterium]